MVFGFENHKPNPKRTLCRLWLWSAWVPHGETKVEDRMVVIGLKILDHWFEISFGSLGFKLRMVVILCLDCWVVAEDRLMGLCLYLCLFSC